ncbi:MAG: hypothetical protein LBH50_02765, partial [Spirochaetaceae bacterium]|nr:hypothetical protein [Spirochaetaceae bacterium]
MPRRNAVCCIVFLGISFLLIACISTRRTAGAETAVQVSDAPEAVSEERFDIWQDNPSDFYAL